MCFCCCNTTAALVWLYKRHERRIRKQQFNVDLRWLISSVLPKLRNYHLPHYCWKRKYMWCCVLKALLKSQTAARLNLPCLTVVGAYGLAETGVMHSVKDVVIKFNLFQLLLSYRKTVNLPLVESSWAKGLIGYCVSISNKNVLVNKKKGQRQLKMMDMGKKTILL